MTFIKRRGLRALGILCAASAILAAVPTGSAFATGISGSATDQGEPKIKEALENAPELKGATFDISGVTFEPAGATATNEKFTPSGSHMFFDDHMANPIDPKDPNQPTRPFTSVSQSWQHTTTESWTRTNEIGVQAAVGYTWSTTGKAPGVAEVTHQVSLELTLSYKYTTAVTNTTSETKTTTSSPQTQQVRPGHDVRIRQWVDVGTYEADMKLNGILRGNIVIAKCGTTVSVPIGRLAAMKRDDGQGPLFADWTPDGDVVRKSGTVHVAADVAALGQTEVIDTLLSDKSSTRTTTPMSTIPTAAATQTQSRTAAMTRSLASNVTEPAAEKTLRSVVPCSTPSDFNGGRSIREWTPVVEGVVAVGNHTFLRPDRTLVSFDAVVDRDVISAVGGWSGAQGKDWATYVRADGRGYTRTFDKSYSQYEKTFDEKTFGRGTVAVGYRTFLTPDGGLYYGGKRIAEDVTSAKAGWASSEWVTFVSNGKGYEWSTSLARPSELGEYPEGTIVVGTDSFLAPDGTLSYRSTVLATGVTSAVGGAGTYGIPWLTFVGNGTGHYWSIRDEVRDELALPDDAKAVGNHLYLDGDGHLYSLDNEVARDVTSAVGGWGGSDWASFVRQGS